MPTTRPRAPGWHPDPDDPGSLRHWDGRRWGSARRPRPSWAPPAAPPASGAPAQTGGGGEEPGPLPSRRRWWVLAALAVAVGLVVVSVPAWLDTEPAIPPRSVADRAFTTKAQAECARSLPPLREQRPESREDTGSENAFAGRIDAAAAALEKVAGRLRTIPVASADGDAAEVARWLADWDAYVAVGRTYAERLRAGTGDARVTRAEAAPLERRIYVFAKANGMPGCTL